MKICKTCNIEKSLDCFYKDKNMVSGCRNKCITCERERCKQYNNNNKEKLKYYSSQYYNLNKEKVLQYCSEYQKNNYNPEIQKIKNQEYNLKNPDKKKQYYWDNMNEMKKYSKEYYNNPINKQKSLEYNKQYEKDNKIKTRTYRKNYVKNKYKTDPLFKLAMNLRGRINSVLKKTYTKKNNKSLNYLDCDLQTYRDHLEQQFLPEFTWENHGIVWEVDHITPLSSFDFSIEDNIYKAFNYKNTKPRFKTTEIAESFGYFDHIGNRNKSNKIL